MPYFIIYGMLIRSYQTMYIFMIIVSSNHLNMAAYSCIVKLKLKMIDTHLTILTEVTVYCCCQNPARTIQRFSTLSPECIKREPNTD